MGADLEALVEPDSRPDVVGDADTETLAVSATLAVSDELAQKLADIAAEVVGDTDVTAVLDVSEVSVSSAVGELRPDCVASIDVDGETVAAADTLVESVLINVNVDTADEDVDADSAFDVDMNRDAVELPVCPSETVEDKETAEVDDGTADRDTDDDRRAERLVDGDNVAVALTDVELDVAPLRLDERLADAHTVAVTLCDKSAEREPAVVVERETDIVGVAIDVNDARIDTDVEPDSRTEKDGVAVSELLADVEPVVTVLELAVTVAEVESLKRGVAVLTRLGVAKVVADALKETGDVAERVSTELVVAVTDIESTGVVESSGVAVNETTAVSDLFGLRVTSDVADADVESLGEGVSLTEETAVGLTRVVAKIVALELTLRETRTLPVALSETRGDCEEEIDPVTVNDTARLGVARFDGDASVDPVEVTLERVLCVAPAESVVVCDATGEEDAPGVEDSVFDAVADAVLRADAVVDAEDKTEREPVVVAAADIPPVTVLATVVVAEPDPVIDTADEALPTPVDEQLMVRVLGGALGVPGVLSVTAGEDEPNALRVALPVSDDERDPAAVVDTVVGELIEETVVVSVVSPDVVMAADLDGEGVAFEDTECFGEPVSKAHEEAVGEFVLDSFAVSVSPRGETVLRTVLETSPVVDTAAVPDTLMMLLPVTVGVTVCDELEQTVAVNAAVAVTVTVAVVTTLADAAPDTVDCVD